MMAPLGQDRPPAPGCFLAFRLINVRPELSREEWHPYQWSHKLPNGGLMLKPRRLDPTERLLDRPPQGGRMRAVTTASL